MVASRRLQELDWKLSELETRHASALEAAGIGVWEWNVQTDELTWDARMLEIFDISEEEFTNDIDFFKKIVHPLDRLSVKKALDDATIRDKAYDITYRIFNKTGVVILVRGRGKACKDSNGEVISMTGICFREKLDSQPSLL